MSSCLIWVLLHCILLATFDNLHQEERIWVKGLQNHLLSHRTESQIGGLGQDWSIYLSCIEQVLTSPSKRCHWKKTLRPDDHENHFQPNRPTWFDQPLFSLLPDQNGLLCSICAKEFTYFEFRCDLFWILAGVFFSASKTITSYLETAIGSSFNLPSQLFKFGSKLSLILCWPLFFYNHVCRFKIKGLLNSRHISQNCLFSLLETCKQ